MKRREVATRFPHTEEIIRFNSGSPQPLTKKKVKKMIYKANHNLRLPDGKTEIKAGEEFEFNGDISSFKEIVDIVGDKGIPVAEPETAGDKADEAAIREKAKELKIGNYWSKRLDNLIKEIAEKEAEGQENAPAPVSDAQEEAPASPEDAQAPEEKEPVND